MVIAIIIGVVIFIVAVIIGQQRGKNLEAEGKIIMRDISFIEYAEIFTLANADFKIVAAELQTTSFEGTGASIGVNGLTVTIRSSHGWSAQLCELQSSDNMNKYHFQFTGWQTHRGVPMRLDTMNIFLTAIEKMFLNLDSNTKVETERFKTKSKTSFL